MNNFRVFLTLYCIFIFPINTGIFFSNWWADKGIAKNKYLAITIITYFGVFFLAYHEGKKIFAYLKKRRS